MTDLVQTTQKKNHTREISGKRRYLTADPQVANISLKKYATNEVKAKTESDTHSPCTWTRHKFGSNCRSVYCKTIPFCDVCEIYAPNEIFVYGMVQSTRHCVRECCESWKKANLHDLAFHAISLLKLKRRDLSTKQDPHAVLHLRKEWITPQHEKCRKGRQNLTWMP